MLFLRGWGVSRLSWGRGREVFLCVGGSFKFIPGSLGGFRAVLGEGWGGCGGAPRGSFLMGTRLGHAWLFCDHYQARPVKGRASPLWGSGPFFEGTVKACWGVLGLVRSCFLGAQGYSDS